MNKERTERSTRTFDPAAAGRDAMTAWRIMKLAHALPRTCGGALRYAPALPTGAAVLWSYDSRSHRRPGILPALGVRGKYSVQQNQGDRPPGACLSCGSPNFPRRGGPVRGSKWKTLLASGHRVQTWSKVERQHFRVLPFCVSPQDSGNERQSTSFWRGGRYGRYRHKRGVHLSDR